MTTRLGINLFILLVLFFGNCFEAWAKLPQACVDANNKINLKMKKRLYSQCIRSGELSSNESCLIYTARGKIYEKLGEYRLAIQDFRKAILMNPNFFQAYISRGNIHIQLGEYKQATQDYEKAIGLKPKDKKGYNNLAWLLVTAEDPQYRDGKSALKLALTALQLTSEQDPNVLDTLAAVYAELGQFDQAIETQQKAIDLLEEEGNKDLIGNYREVISDYKQSRKHYPNSSKISLKVE